LFTDDYLGRPTGRFGVGFSEIINLRDNKYDKTNGRNCHVG
jgi:hypothetical protein